MSRRLNLSGQVFGRLTVLSRAPDDKYGRTVWDCRCECGVQLSVGANYLRRGHTRSCGCLARDNQRQRTRTHGLSKSQEHAIWRGMISRCENPNVKSYDRYGGRGITVAPAWRKDFMAFMADVGPRPSPKHSLDRIDPNGNYEPRNVVWATQREQCNNRRVTRFVTYRGERVAIADAVRMAGSVIHYQGAWNRIQRGWSVEAAVETPRMHVARNAKDHCERAFLNFECAEAA